MLCKGKAIRAYIHIKELAKENSNDMELGKRVREFVNQLNKE